MGDHRPAGANAALTIAFALAVAAVEGGPWRTVAAVERHIMLTAGGGGGRHAGVKVVFTVQRTVDTNLRAGKARVIERGVRRQVGGAVIAKPQRVAEVE